MTLTNSNILIHRDKSFAQVCINKILDYAKRQSKRTDTEKKKDFERLTEEQDGWIRRRMAVPAWTWERWEGMIEEWKPWGSGGEPINVWRYYKIS